MFKHLKNLTKENNFNSSKNYYLVDYENVHNAGFAGIENAKPDDEIHIFYSKNADTISFDTIQIFQNKNIKLHFHKVDVGHNALDFQLSSFLGYLMFQADKNNKFYIISKDKGYSCLKKYWEQYNKNIFIVKNFFLVDETTDLKMAQLETDLFVAARKTKKIEQDFSKLHRLPTEKIKSEIHTVIRNNKDIEIICNSVKNSNTYEELHNLLAKIYKNNEKTVTIYKTAKPVLKSLIVNTD